MFFGVGENKYGSFVLIFDSIGFDMVRVVFEKVGKVVWVVEIFVIWWWGVVGVMMFIFLMGVGMIGINGVLVVSVGMWVG